MRVGRMRGTYQSRARSAIRSNCPGTMSGACVERQPDRVVAIAIEGRRPINSQYSVTMSGACEKASLPCST
eukprot:2093964-Rhodomonas_salina.1